MEATKMSVNKNILSNQEDEGNFSSKKKKSTASDFSDIVSSIIVSAPNTLSFTRLNKNDISVKNNSGTVLSPKTLLNPDRELLKSDKISFKSVKQIKNSAAVPAEKIELKYNLSKQKDDSGGNISFTDYGNLFSREPSVELSSSLEKTIEIQTPVSKENIEKIESILQSRLESVKNGEIFEIKIALKPENLGRIVIKAYCDNLTSKVTVEMSGKSEAIEMFAKNASLISEGLKTSGVDFAGFSFKKENNKEENSKKESKNKKYGKENKRKTILMEA